MTVKRFTSRLAIPDGANAGEAVNKGQLDLKAPLASPTFTGTVSGITKAMVGLGSADNTADSAKSVLSATKLTTARNINGLAFDGTGNITVPAVDSSKEPIITAGTSAQYWRGDKSWQTLNVAAVSGLQTALDGKLATSGVPWCPELVLNSSTLAASYVGYADAIGGLTVEPGINDGILLDFVMLRLCDWAQTFGGSGNLTIDVYSGTATTLGSIIKTFTIAAAANTTTATVSPSVACASNAVLRFRITTGTVTVPGPIQIQCRGRYGV